MTMALLLTLLLPLAQDDPQVTYREGLFEEVDQGNLDKAIELYAKVLKSGAPDAIKAKALLRTGFCHEKKGKKKEAEQAWKDVIERFPSAADVVKQAQQRLTAPGSAEGDTGLGMDGTIQNLILDLGAASAPRMAAIRRLVLIADPAVPYLRKALQHKDARLVWGAAQVLHELDPREDLYEPLMAAYVRHGDPSASDAILGSLFYWQEGLKERFLKDHSKVLKSSLIGRTPGTFSSKVHAAFPDILKEWLIVGPMPSDDAWGQAFAAWTRNTEKPDLVTVIERLPSDETWGWSKIIRMLSIVEAASVTPAFQEAAVKALAAHPRPMETFDQIVQYQGFQQVFEASDLVTRVIAHWFAKGDLRLRKHILEWPRRYGLSNNPNFSRELIDFSFRRLGDETESWETRLAIEASGLSPGTPEHERSLIAFGVAFVKKADRNPEPAARMYQVLVPLVSRIPADSKDLPVVLDAAFDHQVPIPKKLIESNRYAVVEAALRAVFREGRDSQNTLHLIAKSATPEEKVRLIHYLLHVPPEKISSTATQAYVSGLLALPPAAFEPKWKELRGVYAKAPARFQAEIATALAQGDPRIDDFMKEAAQSPHAWVRNAAITHWKIRKEGEGIPHLLKALEDASPDNRVHAIMALGEVRALDAVPALLKFLEGNAGPLREPATEALKLIRAHFEERMEWKRWYDETKKTMEK